MWRPISIAVLLVAAQWACGGDDSASDGGADRDGGAPGDGGQGADAAPGGCGAIATWADGLAPDRELHVATTGSAGGDGSPGAPFATIEQAVAVATPGTAVRVHAGTYAGGEYVADVAGTATAPIWIGGAPGEARPLLDGGSEGLHVSRARYLVLHDLEVANAADNGINVDDGGDRADPDAARYLLFRDLYIHDIGGTGNQDCLKLSGLDDYLVLDSELARCGGGGSGSGIDHVGCHRGLIARNRIHDTSGNAVQVKGGSDDVEILANRMDDAGERAVNMGGSTGFDFFRPPLSMAAPNFEARDVRVIANVITGSIAPIAFVGCDDCLAAHNTLVDPQRWVVRILQETTTSGGYELVPCRDGRFVDNLVYFDASVLSTTVNVGPDTAPDTFEFTTNLWYAHDDPSQSAPDLPVPETGGVVGEDPMIDPTRDYDFCTGFPGARDGTPLPEAPADYGGGCYDPTAPSIGAHQAHSCTI